MDKLSNLQLKQEFDNMSPSQLLDYKYLSDFIFNRVGLKLNTKALKIADGSLDCWGGLRCKQYPDEIAKLLVFLNSHKNEINSYCEIGVERGGTFFLIDSFLRSINPNMGRSVGLDVGKKIIKHGFEAYKKKYPQVEFIRMDSTDFIPDQFFDFCLIDGDHRFRGCNNDYVNMRRFAKYIGFHDINFRRAGVKTVWKSILYKEKYEFMNEDSRFKVPLGIGVVRIDDDDRDSFHSNDLEIRVFGLRRIGNHAIINWISAQAPHCVHFFNNCPSDNPPYHTRSSRGTRPGLEHIFYKHKKFRGKNKQFWDSFPNMHKEVLLYSYENFNLSALGEKNREYPIDREIILGKSQRRIDVVILRDVFNWVASRMVCNEKTRIHPNQRREVESKPYFSFYKGWVDDAATIRSSNFLRLGSSLKLWVVYAKEILRETNFMPGKMVILFNRWFADKEYRRQIISEIGFNFTDAGKNVVAAISSKGSSFDGLEYSQEAEKMKVLERWKNYRDNRIYKNIFLHYPDIVKYNNSIFGENKEITEWLAQG